MIAALARGGAVLDDDKYLAAAEDAAAFVKKELTDGDGNLLHRYRNGEAGIPAFLDDYAFTIWGLTELFESGGKAEYLAEALRLAKILIASFSDPDNGGFYFTSADAEQLITRMKEVYDGAVPSGNSVAAYSLLRLGKITGDQELFDRGIAVIEAFGETVKQNPAGFSMMMAAVDFAVGPVREIVITGDPDDDLTRQMVSLIISRFLPRTVLILNDVRAGRDAVQELIPFTKNQVSIGGITTAYVCENFQCQAPVNEVEELEKLLD
ncbi:MAG: thioredoxin domain-containing protein [FCB group bacterium]|nr:thioredoxin domain-containing protein [FCB group bacterium]